MSADETELKKLQIQNQFLSEYLSLLISEMRTSITIARGYSELLLRELVGALNEEQKQLLRMIRDLSIDGAGRIDQVILLRAIDSQQLLVTPELFNISSLIADNIRKNQKKYNHSSRNVCVEQENDAIHAFADVRLVEMVIDALINNAFRYTSDNESIVVVLEVRDKDVVIHIKDTGPGIRESRRAHLFERHNAGLGLFIAKHVTELNNGKIVVADNCPKGTIFTLSFPTSSDLII